MTENTFSACKENLKQKGYEVLEDVDFTDNKYEFDEDLYSIVHVKGCGTFLVVYEKGDIEHYVRENENPTKEQIAEIVEEVRTAAKKEKLKIMF